MSSSDKPLLAARAGGGGGGGAGGGGGDDDDAWLVAACDEPDCLCLPPGACAEANARLCTPFQMGPACPPR